MRLHNYSEDQLVEKPIDLFETLGWELASLLIGMSVPANLKHSS